MPSPDLEYPKQARNTVVRKGKDRGKYDLTTVHTILNSALVVHVSFTPGGTDPFPTTLPMIGFMGSYSRPSAGLDEPLDCYLHGYVSSRLMNLSRKSATAEGSAGLPVCVSASKVDGLVLSLTPNSHSYNYRSAVLFGYAELVSELDEKLWAMQQITNKVLAGRWENTRVPPNAAEMSSTQILRVKVESGSAKVRDGPPGDEKADLADGELVDRVWTGYVPLVEQLAEPVPSTYNRVKEVPEYIREYREVFNEVNQDYVEMVLEKVKAGPVKNGE